MPFHRLLLAGLACLSIVVSLLGAGQALGAVQALQAPAFLRADGATLRYRDQAVMLRGVNFNNLPALGARIGSGSMADINIHEDDYAYAAALGANHVRFGLSFNWYMADRAGFIAMLKQHTLWARSYNLWLVPVLFTTPGNCYEGYDRSCGLWNSPAEQEALLRFWVDIAGQFSAEPAMAGFDLLNEPTPGTNMLRWFNLAQRIRDAVSAVAPNQLVFIMAGPSADFWYSFRGQNIVYEVHDYIPLPLPRHRARQQQRRRRLGSGGIRGAGFPTR
jgi:hypothetical protein